MNPFCLLCSPAPFFQITLPNSRWFPSKRSVPASTHGLLSLLLSQHSFFPCHACRLSVFSCVPIFVTLQTLACQAPLFLWFSRHKYWSGLPCPPPQGSSWPRDRIRHSYVSQIGSQGLYQSCHLGSPILSVQFCSVHFSRSVVSDSLRPHGLQQASPPCPSPTPGVYSNLSIKSVMPTNHLILRHPLLLLPSIFPSIRVFSNESVLRIRWPKH